MLEICKSFPNENGEMRILLINYEYPPVGGGAANATYFIAKYLRKLGNEIFILTSSYKRLKGWTFEDGINVLRCPTIRKRAYQSNIYEMLIYVLSSFFILPSLLKKRKIDVSIVFFGFPCGPLGLWGKLAANVPYIVSLRGGDVPGTERKLDWIHSILKGVRKRVYHKSLCVVSNSEGLKKISESSDDYMVTVIPNGVDSSYFTLKNYNKSNNSVFKFLFVGRFNEQKNLFYLLDQMKELNKKGKKSFELHFVGDGPQSHELKAYAQKLCIDHITHWHGWLGKDELKNFYTMANCIINPSLYEGMPNTVLEAMACGTPVIASNVAGNASLVKNGKSGYLFDITDNEQFLSSAMALMSDHDVLKQMGMNCRLQIETKFSWEHAASEYLKICQRA